ncbi:MULTISPECIES: flagellin [Pseudoalteromonas]|jgi:flagellin|uniref:Flagellin n=2 Tax=Pseudoalteromonas TaxID=53246 RepID=A0AA37S3A9_9GAMM|nr:MULTISPECIES: flagellin [Pseudoalteromonas]MAY59729.1 Lateral flagellin [Pseudoalteromonas sp.]ATD02510.1 flagellin [Pseudoalteromonas tetraodonis]MDN3404468.1 flagellin [Pseudoalteromonas sp. APC 3218]MDN3408371.1 flagellin [Pseudoalteromonas sp. APC 3894]MDN3411791.1 flagellin [Pseudoalteromonas sp. APC 3250]|tara:strand:+ start:581 stop:1420 length:840 start_codon:yes stop_codon:yes gene_type:complete
MALSIQSNMASMSIQNQLGRSNNDLSTALERLGSGFKINSAKDDAAGLQIASRLNAQVRGQDAGLYNGNNAMSMMQTAEGAFDEMTNIAYRMKELATQGSSDTNGAKEWAAQSAEYTALATELTNIMTNTSFGDGTKLLAAAGKFGAGAVNFQVGSSAAETLNVDISTELGNVTTAIGNAAAFTDVATAQAQIAFVDTLVGEIGTARSTLGASMNRLDHTMTNVSNMKQNTQAAVGTLMDADFAAETSNMTKQQLLMNSGISVLSTANSTTQMIGSLLR